MKLPFTYFSQPSVSCGTPECSYSAVCAPISRDVYHCVQRVGNSVGGKWYITLDNTKELSYWCSGKISLQDKKKMKQKSSHKEWTIKRWILIILSTNLCVIIPIIFASISRLAFRLSAVFVWRRKSMDCHSHQQHEWSGLPIHNIQINW